MTDLTYTIIDGDFPAGVKNKTATLVTSENEALLVDAGFTRADGHRLAAAVLDSGRQLTTVVISHADPDFYFGAEVIADAFPGARFLATRSEEHTSELQSPCNLVCRLLLEKQKLNTLCSLALDRVSELTTA